MHPPCTTAATGRALICRSVMILLDSLRAPHRAQQFSTAEMVKALDRHPAARRRYWRLYDRTARADEPGIHGRRRARISGGRRERGGGDRNVRLEAPMTVTAL